MMQAASVVLAGVAGCSFGMHGVDPQWDGKSEPKCDSDTITRDRIVGVSLVVAGAGAFAKTPNEIRPLIDPRSTP